MYCIEVKNPTCRTCATLPNGVHPTLLGRLIQPARGHYRPGCRWCSGRASSSRCRRSPGRGCRPSTFPNPTRSSHALLYGVLGGCFAAPSPLADPRQVVARICCSRSLIATAYGISDEIHQLLTPQRSADWRDVVADASGAALGVMSLVAMRWMKFRGCFMMVRSRTANAPRRENHASNTLALPGDVEALVAAPGRGVARPLVTFLRSQGISVQTAGDADSAFEEALLHPPDVVLIDDRIPPAGGIELCQRLKGNVRTHFVPTIVFALNDLRAFRLRASPRAPTPCSRPATDAQERRTRLWALLRTPRPVHAVREEAARAGQRRSSSGAAGSATSCTICRGRSRRCRPTSTITGALRPAQGRRCAAPNFRRKRRRCPHRLRPAHAATCGRCMDFDRYESGQLRLKETPLLAGRRRRPRRSTTLRRHAQSAERRSRSRARPPMTEQAAAGRSRAPPARAAQPGDRTRIRRAARAQSEIDAVA